ncbi:Lariat debranching enzyme [Oopsacas minuta]|uniref:Lariat debranching enzyme n=1 Tax=Oopsacas minuta TaxID=111878 RepID=A0AAV7JLR9_9METZ|nr:Lariat debranching enzyme [Oopsacas minuta]
MSQMSLTIAIEGCCHGELDNIYSTIDYIQKENNIEIDLLLCCGDFEAVRCPADLDSMSVPLKYRNMGTFYKYYTGEKVAPVLTIFIGGNHEAANYLWELGHGGWAAPNIYYLGFAGVVNFGGIRIGGLSGIYGYHDFYKGHFEAPPFNESTKRSFYHTRNFEIFQLKQVRRPIEVFMTHDWPNHITDFGDRNKLVRFKPYLHSDIEKGELGNPHSEQLIYSLKPDYWFAAHLHCKFAALVPHEQPVSSKECDNLSDAKRQKVETTDKPQKFTKFLALSKCLPGKHFLQVLTLPSSEGDKILTYDAEWLSILKSTHEFYPVTEVKWVKPTQRLGDRWIFTPTDVEMEDIRKLFNHDLTIPQNFVKTVEPFDMAYRPNENPQTRQFCQKLGIINHFKLKIMTSQRHSFSMDTEYPCAQESGAYTLYSPTDHFPAISPNQFSTHRELQQNMSPDITAQFPFQGPQ